MSKKRNTKNNFTTTFELSDGTETPDYPSIISYYKELSEEYSTISLFSFGETDAGRTTSFSRIQWRRYRSRCRNKKFFKKIEF